MLRDLPKNIKAALLIFAVLITMSVVYGVYTVVNRSGKVQVTIDIVPADATATLNGTPISSGETYITPGKYTIKANKEGFAEYSREFDINEEGQLITILLTPVSTEAQDWVRQNEREYLGAEGRAGEAAIAEGEAFRKQNPIVDVLPYSSLLYTIGYRADPSDPSGNSIILTIDASEGYRNAAIEQIRNLGYDPTNYKINFKDYKNPFEP